MHDLMSPQPASLTQEVLAGLIERVTYHNAENGFCVLRTKARAPRRCDRGGLRRSYQRRTWEATMLDPLT
jgi:hypothetical protein